MQRMPPVILYAEVLVPLTISNMTLSYFRILSWQPYVDIIVSFHIYFE